MRLAKPLWHKRYLGFSTPVATPDCRPVLRTLTPRRSREGSCGEPSGPPPLRGVGDFVGPAAGSHGDSPNQLKLAVLHYIPTLAFRGRDAGVDNHVIVLIMVMNLPRRDVPALPNPRNASAFIGPGI